MKNASGQEGKNELQWNMNMNMNRQLDLIKPYDFFTFLVAVAV